MPRIIVLAEGLDTPMGTRHQTILSERVPTERLAAELAVRLARALIAARDLETTQPTPPPTTHAP